MEYAEDINIGLLSLGFPAQSGSEIFSWSKDGISSGNIRQIIVYLCDDLKKFLNLEETLQLSDDISTFAIELAGFLRELNCAIPELIAYECEDRFLDPINCLNLLDFLITELQAVRLLAKSNPGYLKKVTNAAPVVSGKSSQQNAYHLQKLCQALGFPKPPPNISAEELSSKINSRTNEVISSLPPDVFGKPLIQCQISQKQWEALVTLNDIFTEEYALRREMLLTRLDVTIRSFGWGNKARSAQIEKVYIPLRQSMRVRTGLRVCSILAARDDLIRIRKTCDGSIRDRTKCDINKVSMGKVPDRGGRANEYDAPPPEMPQWQKRQPDSGFRGGRGGRGRGGGHQRDGAHGGHGNVFDRLDGGRPQTAGGGGGYNNNKNFRPQSNFDQFGGGGGGGYQHDDRAHSAGRGGRGGHRGRRGRY